MKITLKTSLSVVKLKSLQIMIFLFAQKTRFVQKKRRKLHVKINALKEAHSYFIGPAFASFYSVVLTVLHQQ